MQDKRLPEGHNQDDIDYRLKMMADGKLLTPEEMYKNIDKKNEPTT